jgi:CBS domain-containing protein
MSGHRIRHLVVTDGGQAVGIIIVMDLARHLEHSGVANYLRAAIGRGGLLETQGALMLPGDKLLEARSRSDREDCPLKRRHQA